MSDRIEHGFGVQTAVGLIHVPLVVHVATKLPDERNAGGMHVMLLEDPAGKFDEQVPAAVFALNWVYTAQFGLHTPPGSSKTPPVQV